MKTTIQTKITAYYIIIILVAFALIIGVSQNATTRYLKSNIEKNLIDESKIITNLLIDEIKNDENIEQTITEKIQNMKHTIGRYNLESDINVVIELPNRVVNIGKRTDFSKDELDKLIKLSKSKDYGTFELTAKDNMTYFVLLKPVLLKENIRTDSKIYLIMYVNQGEISSFVKQIRRIQLLATLAFLTIALILGSFVSNNLTKPLRKLNEQAKLIAKGDFPKEIKIESRDEIGELTESVNRMSKSLENNSKIQKRFFQNASHELKTPLMSIQGYAEGMIDGIFERSDENLEIINSEVKRLSNIVNNISYLTKLDTLNDDLNLRNIDIYDIIINSIKKIKGLTNNSNIEIKVDNLIHLEISVDENQFTQALINILSNAFRYCKNEIIIDTIETNNHIEISVIDDGDGIQEDAVSHIFERFYKGPDGHTGLGLSIARSIIEKHRGEITAENTLDKGAKFTIILYK